MSKKQTIEMKFYASSTFALDVTGQLHDPVTLLPKSYIFSCIT